MLNYSTRKPRLLFITQDRAIGGGTSSLSALYGIIKNAYDISVFLLTDEGNAEVSYSERIVKSKAITDLYYRNYSLLRGYKRFLSAFVKICFKALKHLGINVDKIHVRYNINALCNHDLIISYGEGIATIFAQYIPDCPRIAWIHNEISRQPYSPAFQDLYSKYDHIVTVSNVIANGLKKIYPHLAEKVSGICNIVDTQRIKRLAEESISEHFSSESFNIISIGRLSPVKRFTEIPHIVSEMQSYSKMIKWRIIGPETGGSERDILMENIHKFNVEGEVEYLGDKVNPYPYLAKSDLLVILSFSEACPMVITEARTLSVPIVSTDFTTAYEFIDDNVDGVVRPISKIAFEIDNLIRDRQRYSQIKLNSANRKNDNDENVRRFNLLIDLVFSQTAC